VDKTRRPFVRSGFSKTIEPTSILRFRRKFQCTNHNNTMLGKKNKRIEKLKSVCYVFLRIEIHAYTGVTFTNKHLRTRSFFLKIYLRLFIKLSTLVLLKLFFFQSSFLLTRASSPSRIAYNYGNETYFYYNLIPIRALVTPYYFIICFNIFYA